MNQEKFECCNAPVITFSLEGAEKVPAKCSLMAMRLFETPFPKENLPSLLPAVSRRLQRRSLQRDVLMCVENPSSSSQEKLNQSDRFCGTLRTVHRLASSCWPDHGNGESERSEDRGWRVIAWMRHHGVALQTESCRSCVVGAEVTTRASCCSSLGGRSVSGASYIAA
jgi:hypothetical protein